MLIQCVSCAKKLNVPDNAAGKKARCPACKTVFDIAATAAVAAPALPPPVHVDDDNEDARPSRFRDMDEEDEDRAEAQRPTSQTREQEDDDAVAAGQNEVPAPGAAARGDAAGVAAQAAAIARWLRLAALVLIVAFIIGLVAQYLVAEDIQTRARRRPREPVPMAPLTAVLIFAVPGALILGPCVAFMLIGAGNARKLKGRGMVMTALIITLVLGVLYMFADVAQGLATMLFPHLFQIVQLVVLVGTTAILLIAGFRGLTLMGRPGMNQAFGGPAPSPPPRGRPSRRRLDPDDDDELDDEEYESPRRRRRDDD
jgi:hypothetical protein